MSRSDRLCRGVQVAALAAAFVALLFSFRDTGDDEPLIEAAQRRRMPEVAYPGLDGNPWRLSDHRGRVVLINFWATWCPPCRQETPALLRVYEEYREQGYETVGVTLDEGSLDPVRRFARSYRVSYPILVPGAASPLASAISALPTTFLIDREGRIARVYYGAAAEAILRRDVKSLLAGS